MITSGAVPAPLLHHHRRVTTRHAQDHDFADPLGPVPAAIDLLTRCSDASVREPGNPSQRVL